MEHLGLFLKQRDTTIELTIMFKTLMNYYAYYQNAYVKHIDNVKQDEIELMVHRYSGCSLYVALQNT